jgi:arsenite methyltransferase
MSQRGSDAIRKEVSEAYVKALQKPASGCGCGCSPDPRGVAARVAGYTGAEVGDLPRDAVASSFGCGNPLAYAGVEPGQTVLDLGSGAGIDLLLAARRVGADGRVIGVDMTPEMVERARANAAAAGAENVEVRQGIIEELPVESGSVDWVISNCVINLSPEKERVFAEIARVLRPEGRFSISDIVAEELPAWAREVPSVYASCVGGAISEKAYLDGLRAAGLRDVEVEERLVYSAAQIVAVLESEKVEGFLGATGKTAQELAGELEGQVASVKVVGRK